MAKSRTEFNRKDWENLNQAERLLHDVLPEFDKAESCGVDCTHRREIQAEIARLLSNIRKHYLPEAPKS